MYVGEFNLTVNQVYNFQRCSSSSLCHIVPRTTYRNVLTEVDLELTTSAR